MLPMEAILLPPFQDEQMKNTPINLLILFASTLVILLGAELGLRLLGYHPWTYITYDAKEPTTYKDDKKLGWTTKEGYFTIPPYHPEGTPITITFLKGGLRKTYEGQNNQHDNRPKAIFVGGSVTQGWAVSDEETFTWKLQSLLPDLEVLNYGVGGYGTYQSLLVLEQVLPQISNPHFVVYGLIGPHEDRNVAPSSWMRGLSRSQTKGHIAVPYATLNDREVLSFHAPERYRRWPFDEKSAIIFLAEKAFMRLLTADREGQKRKVTQELLLNMSQLCTQHNVIFIIAMLYGTNEIRNHYKDFSQSQGFNYVDCAFPLTRDMKVKGEHHPNGKLHSKYAQCIHSYLQSHLSL